MNRIVNAARLDLYSAKSSMRIIIITYVIPIIIGAATKRVLMAAGLLMIFAVFLGGSVFAVNERTRSDRLYGILPLRKSEVVLGRYLYVVILGVGNLMIAGILAYVLSLIFHVGLDRFSFVGALSMSLVYYFFAAGVSYPIYFKFGFAKAYVFTAVPLYLIMIAVFVLMNKFNFAGNIINALQFFMNHQALAPIFSILIAAVFLVVSAWISNFIYRTKEI